MQLETYPLKQHAMDLSQESFPVTLRTWHGNSLEFPVGGTNFGYIYQGSALLFRQGTGEAYRLHAGMYFCLPGGGKLEGENSSGMAISSLNYQGMFSLGGPLGSTGRLAYINGGTNSLLIAPVMGGDPCFNAMYFPPGVDQTLHTHPSYRIGMVVMGRGELESQQTVIVLEPGMTFLIPADSLHKFRTIESNLTVVVFHPDSESGFIHGDNLMLKRTIVNGVSASELPDIQTKMAND
jgi:mannose-6-phosphate isomerase-like protein (cupin superfamily)